MNIEDTIGLKEFKKIGLDEYAEACKNAKGWRVSSFNFFNFFKILLDFGMEDDLKIRMLLKKSFGSVSEWTIAKKDNISHQGIVPDYFWYVGRNWVA